MKNSRNNDVMKKVPVLYLILLLIWTVLTVFLWFYFVKSFINVPFVEGATISDTVRVLATILLVFNAIFISYFWLNGVKDFIYVIWFYIVKRKLYKKI